MGNAGARLGITLAFGALGGAAGQGVGFAVGAMIGGVVASLLFPIESPDQSITGPRIEDLSIQTSTYGNAIPLAYGTVRIAGNVIWSTGLIESALTEDIQTGGKGGGDTPTRTTYSYSASFAIGLCRGPIIGIRRIWADDKLWFDFSDPQVGAAFNHQLYLGTEDQLPDPTIESYKGAGNVPAHRGLAYIVIQNLQLARFGNRIPNFHFEVVVTGTTSAHVTAVPDAEPSGTFGGKLAIDLETGLVWESREAPGRIRIYRPDTLELVREITGVLGVRGLSYQPPFPIIRSSPLTDPTIAEVRPRMFAGADRAGLIGGGIWSFETRSYEAVHLTNPQGYWGNWFGEVVVDLNTITLDSPIQEDAPLVAFFNSNLPGVDLAITYRISLETSGGFGNQSPYNFQQEIQDVFDGASTTPGTYMVIADHAVAEQNHSLYLVNWMGEIVRLESGTYQLRDGPVRPVAAVYNVDGLFLAWDPFESKLYALLIEYSNLTAHIVKLSADLQTEEWRVSRTNIEGPYTNLAIHPQTGELYAIYRATGAQGVGSTMFVRELNKTDGSTLRDFETDYSMGLSHLTDFVIYPHSMFAFGSRGGASPCAFLKIPLIEAPAGSPPTLAAVVQDLCEETGLEAADLNVAQLASDTVRGYAIATRTPARTAIEPLMRGYFFDAVESDHQIKFVKRGGASIATIPTTALGARQASERAKDPREWNRTEENELPWQVDVRYLDETGHYKINTQYDRRLIGQSQEAVTVDLPIVFTATEAKRIAQVLLYNAWMDRTRIACRLSRQYLKLDPTDVITITEGDESTTYRLAKMSYSAPNLLEAEAIEEDASVYQMSGIGADPAPPAQELLTAVPTILYLLDLPPLRDQDDNVGIYVGGAGAVDGWDSAEVFRSPDAVAYSPILALETEVTAGAAQTTLTWEGDIP